MLNLHRFLFVVAGHETSSNALHTALLMLACEPDIQTQVQKEMDAIWADKKEGDDWCYETDYPKMRHTMAVVVRIPNLPFLSLTPQLHSISHVERS